MSFFKKRFLSILFLIFISSNVFSQEQLLIADSLFKAKKYTEAFAQYDSIFKNGFASEQMLMKMAFIEEALDHKAQAIYYLENLAEITKDKNTKQQIQKIAKEQNLSGYNYTDSKILANLLNNNKIAVLIILLILTLISFFGIYKKRNSPSKYAWLTSLIVLIIIAALIINEPFKPKQGVISENSYTFQAASAASEPTTHHNAGDKVTIIEEGAVWTLTIDGDRTGYIRSNKLLKIH